jgi:Flp pilus assembly protein TadG
LGGERGVALPTTMILLIVMLGAAGFAIDVGHWYLTANRAQQAADAGALAGVTKLPLDEPGSRTTAFEAAGANGFSSSDITVEDGNRANQLRVTVERTVDNFFAGLFGVNQTTITRTALAEFQGPSVMGSPNNWLGNNTSYAHVQPEFWLMNAAPGSPPVNGDRFQAGNGSTEYDPNGYTYKLDVKSVPASGDLILEAFDPGQVDVGFTGCGRLPSDSLNQELVNDHPALYGNGGTYTMPGENARERYERGRWEPNAVVGGVVVSPSDHIYCTADNGSVDVTTFMLRAPDLTPQNDLDNPVIYSGTCQPRQFRGFSDTGGDNIHKYLDPDDGWRDGDHAEFAGQFRQWVTLCSIPNNLVEVGQYILQVRTNSPMGSPESIGGGGGSGLNKYALRAGFGTAGVETLDGTAVSLAATGRLPMFVGAVAANTEFFLTRVPPATNGSFIEVSFWDVGDGAGNGHIQVLPPIEYMNSDGTYGPAGTNVFRDCIWEDTIGTTGGTPNPGNNCTLDNVNGTFNGDLVTVYVPIPADYNCAVASNLGCWVKLRFQWDAGADVFDHTVWSAGLSGDPIRLVE